MSRSTFRRIRRLRAAAEPVIAERARQKSDWVKSFPRLAEEHLIRLCCVFLYGDPQIDEPLLLCDSDDLTLKVNDPSSLPRWRNIIECDPPAGVIKSKIPGLVQQMPDWLLYFCQARLSLSLLGLEAPPLSQCESEYVRTKWAWPFLPEEVVLKPRRDYSEQCLFVDEMSMEELLSVLKICEKPEGERTRLERRFLQEMQDRELSVDVPGSPPQSKQ